MDNTSLISTVSPDIVNVLCNPDPILIAVLAIVFLGGAIANGLLLFALFKDPLKCFRTPTSYFIGNLALSDIYFLLLTAEFNSVYLVKLCISEMNEFDVGFKINIALVYQGYFLSFPSILSVALERYLAIAFPLWHKVHFTPRLCRHWIIAVWIFVVIYSSVNASLELNEITSTALLSSTFSMTLFAATPLVYIAGFFSIRMQRLRLKSDHSTSEIARQVAKARLRTENHFLCSICIINCCLLLTTLPWLIKYFHGSGNIQLCPKTNVVSELVCELTNFSFLLNFAVNPYIYIWRFPKYRKTFLVLYCKCCQQRNSGQTRPIRVGLRNFRPEK